MSRTCLRAMISTISLAARATNHSLRMVPATALFLGATLLQAAPVTPIITAASPVTVGKTLLAASVPAQTGVTYLWSFSPVDGGSITSGQGTTAIKYTAGSTVQSVTLSCKVTATVGGSSATGQKAISMIAAPVAPTITADSVVTTATTGHIASVNPAEQPATMTYQWTITDGTVSAGGTTATATYTAGSTLGTAALSLTCTVKNAAGSTAASTKTVDVCAKPVATVTVSKGVKTGLTYVTKGGTTFTAEVPAQAAGFTYTWTFPGGGASNISGDDTNEVTFDVDSGATTVVPTCVVTNPANFTATGSKTLTAVADPSTVVINTLSNITQGATTLHSIALTPATIPGATYAWQTVATVTYTSATTASTTYKTTTTNTSSPANSLDNAILSLTCVITNQDGTQATTPAKLVHVWAVPMQPTIVMRNAADTADETQIGASTLGHIGRVTTSTANTTFTWALTNATVARGQGTGEITYNALTATPATVKCTPKNPAGTPGTVSATKTLTVVPKPVATVTVNKAPKTNLLYVTEGVTTYSAQVPAQTDCTYSWTLPQGGQFTLHAGSNLTDNPVLFDVNAATASTTPVTISCLVTSPWGATNTGTKSLTIVHDPSTAVVSVPTGQDNITQGAAATHTVLVSTIPGATYLWPAAGSITYASRTVASTTYTTSLTNTSSPKNLTGTDVVLTCTVTNQDGTSASAVAKTVKLWAAPTTPVINCFKVDNVTAETSVGASTTGHIARITSPVVLDDGTNTTYAWTVTNGTITAGQGTNQITYSAYTGTPLTVKVTAKNPAQTLVTSNIKSLTVVPAPNGTVTVDRLTKLNLTYVTKGGTGYAAHVPARTDVSTFDWSITGGTITSSAPYTNAINFDVDSGAASVVLKCTVTNSLGSSNPDTPKTLTAVADPSTASINTANDISAILTGATTTYSISVTPTISGATAKWQPTTGVTYTSSTSMSTTYKPSLTATQDITLNCTVTNQDGISAVLTPKTVHLWALPATPTIVADDSSLEIGTTGHNAHVSTSYTDPMTFSWTFNNGGGLDPAGQTGSAITYKAPTSMPTTGTMTITCQAVNKGNGKSTAATLTLPIVPNATVTGPSTVTVATITPASGTTPLPISAPVQSSVTYAWSIDPAGTTTTNAHITTTLTTTTRLIQVYVGDTTGTVRVKCVVTSTLGSHPAATGYLNMNVVAAPAITSFTANGVSPTATIAYGSPVVLNAVYTPGSGATVDNGVGAITSGVDLSAIYPHVTTTYKLSVPNTAVPPITTTQTVAVTVNPGFYATSNTLTDARKLHSSTLMEDGTIVVAGGTNASLVNSAYTFTTDVSGAGGAFTPFVTLTNTRSDHVAVRLPNGNLMLAGGVTSGTTAVNTMEIHDPTSATVSGTTLQSARKSATGTLLANGKVLIVGGIDAAGTALNTAELYDPIANTTTATGSLITARYNHTATLLQSGKVLIAGGQSGPNTPVNTAQVYDPSTGTFGSAITMTTDAVNNKGRIGASATLLTSGNVLIYGGTDAAASNPVVADKYLLFTASSSLFSLSTSTVPQRYNHTATLLPTLKVLVAGGTNASGTDLDTADLLTSTATPMTVTATDTLTSARTFHKATILNNGEVLVTGGSNGATVLNTAELFNSALSTAVTPQILILVAERATFASGPSIQIMPVFIGAASGQLKNSSNVLVVDNIKSGKPFSVSATGTYTFTVKNGTLTATRSITINP
jgi:hypothetical protein